MLADVLGFINEGVKEKEGGKKEGEKEPTDQFITNQHHNNRVRRNPLDRIQIPNRIHAGQAAIAAFTRTQSAGAMIVAYALHFAEPIGSPLADEGVFVVVVGHGSDGVGAGALFAGADGGGWFGLGGGEDGAGEGVQRLAEGAFARPVVGFGVGDDAFGAGVGVEVRAGRDVVDCCWHGGGAGWRVFFGGGAGGG